MISLNFDFLIFQTKNTSCLTRWKEKQKDVEFISRFKRFHGWFLTHIKIARFVASLIVLGKWEVSPRLQIYPKKTLKRTNKARQALEKFAQGVWVKHVRREGTKVRQKSYRQTAFNRTPVVPKHKNFSEVTKSKSNNSYNSIPKGIMTVSQKASACTNLTELLETVEQKC